MNKILGVGFFGYLCLVPLVFSIILIKEAKSTLDSDEFKTKFSSLYLNLRTSSHGALLYTFVFLFRRLMLALTIILLDSSPLLQGYLIVLASFLNLVYIIRFRPFEERITQFFEIFNELTILSVSVGIFVNIGDQTDDAARFGFGWFLTGLVVLNVAANLLNVIVTTGSKVFKSLKSLWQKLKEKCAKKAKIDVNIEKLHDRDASNQGKFQLKKTTVEGHSNITDFNEIKQKPSQSKINLEEDVYLNRDETT